MLVYIKWMSSLEPVYCHESDSVGELRRRMMSAHGVPLAHKLLVHKGLLLRDGMQLAETGVEDDSTLHLVLNERPFQGKAMMVKTSAGGAAAGGSTLRTIYVTEHFKIEDVKEDIYAFPGEAAPESQVLIFVGKQLENDRSLREYNIQKGSCLRVINATYARNDIKSFVRCTYPSPDALHVPVSTSIVVQMTSVEEDEETYWGHLLGSPDLETIVPQQVQVREKATYSVVRCRMTLDMWARTITLSPNASLKPGTHYQVIVNRAASEGNLGLRHSKANKQVEGVMRWSFFTEGYEPLRAMQIYPLPWSTVSQATARIVITLSGKLHGECVERGARDWIRVRTSDGHTMLDPYYDEASNSLVYESSRPFLAGDMVRVRLLVGLMQGASGQTLLPTQADGLTKTAPFVWNFSIAEASRYETEMQKSCGVQEILQRALDWRNGVSVAEDAMPRPLLARQLPMQPLHSPTAAPLEYVHPVDATVAVTRGSANKALSPPPVPASPVTLKRPDSHRASLSGKPPPAGAGGGVGESFLTRLTAGWWEVVGVASPGASGGGVATGGDPGLWGTEGLFSSRQHAVPHPSPSNTEDSVDDAVMDDKMLVAARYADSSRDASWTSARRRGETSSLAGMHIDDGDASGTGGGGQGGRSHGGGGREDLGRATRKSWDAALSLMKHARPGADESMSPRKGELTGAGGEEQSVNNMGAGQIKVTGAEVMGNGGSGVPRLRQQVEEESSGAARSGLERGDGPLRGHMSARDARKRAQLRGPRARDVDGVATVKTFKSPRSLLSAEGSPEVSDRREGHVLPAECGTRLDTAASDLRNKQVNMLAECGLNAAEIEEALNKVEHRNTVPSRAGQVYLL